MIKQEENRMSYSILSLTEFIEKYKENEMFKKWFSYLEEELFHLSISKEDGYYNRFLIFSIFLLAHIDFLDPALKQKDITIRLQVISFRYSANETVCRRVEGRLGQLRVIGESDFIELFRKLDPKFVAQAS